MQLIFCRDKQVLLHRKKRHKNTFIHHTFSVKSSHFLIFVSHVDETLDQTLKKKKIPFLN